MCYFKYKSVSAKQNVLLVVTYQLVLFVKNMMESNCLHLVTRSHFKGNEVNRSLR